MTRVLEGCEVSQDTNRPCNDYLSPFQASMRSCKTARSLSMRSKVLLLTTQQVVTQPEGKHLSNDCFGWVQRLHTSVYRMESLWTTTARSSCSAGTMHGRLVHLSSCQLWPAMCLLNVHCIIFPECTLADMCVSYLRRWCTLICRQSRHR